MSSSSQCSYSLFPLIQPPGKPWRSEVALHWRLVQLLPELCWHTTNLEITFSKWILPLLVFRNVSIVLNMLLLEPFQIPNPDSLRIPSEQNSTEENGNNYTGIAMRLVLAHYSPSARLSTESETAIIRGATSSPVSPAFPALSIQGGHH